MISKEVKQLVDRSLDRHVRLAVTGLSRAGKTAFITSLVNQLLHSSQQQNLPLLDAARDKQLLGAKRVAQSDVMVPRFEYNLALEQLYAQPANWPEPTRDVSEIRLAIRYKVKRGLKKYFQSNATLYLDIIDYPGEWLLDLPLLEMSFEQWSDSQFAALKGQRAELAKDWLVQLSDVDAQAVADDNRIVQLAASYTQYLQACKQAGLHWVQPGRFVLPGELDGAPILHFFPLQLSAAQREGKVSKQSNYHLLQQRFEQYKQKIVKRFYRKHFASFDRQIILVDCLQPLSCGSEAFHDMSQALNQLMESFKYGRNSTLQRLFAPKIDKVLFAATKADHITPDQHNNLTQLLQQLVQPTWQHAAYEDIDMECVSLASIRATLSGVTEQDQTRYPCLQGETLQGEKLLLYPGQIPAKLPDVNYWQQAHFELHPYRPLTTEAGQALAHIRMDRALQFLLGDKLR